MRSTNKQRLIPLLALALALNLAGCVAHDKDRLLSDSREFIAVGKLESAAGLLRQAIEKHPTLADAHLLLTDIYLRRGQRELAKQQFETVSSKPIGDAAFRLNYADLLLRYRGSSEALALLDGLSVPPALEPTRLTLMAKGKAQRAQFADSEALFRQASALDPGNAAARLGLAQLYLLLDRNERGSQLLSEFARAHPKHTGPHYMQLRLSLKSGDRDVAIEHLHRIRSLDPADLKAAYLLGLVHLSAKSTDGAMRVVRELRAINADNPVATRLQSLVHLNEGQFELAAEGLADSLESLPDLPGYVYAGIARYKLHQYQEAESLFRRALAIDGVDEHANVMLAFTLYKTKNFAQSQALADWAVRRHPRNALLHNVLGASYIALAKFDQAYRHLSMATQLDRRLGQQFLHSDRVAVNLNSTGFAAAEDAIELRIDPTPLQTRALVGFNLLRSKNHELLISTMEGWLEDESTQPLFYFMLAQAYQALDDAKQASRYLEMAKAKRPDFSGPRLVIAKQLIENGKFAAAEIEYGTLIRQVPGNVLARLNLANLYELLGHEEAAAKVFDDTAKPDNVTAIVAQAGFMIRRGQRQGAIELLRQAAERFPNNPHLLQYLGEALVAHGETDEGIRTFLKIDRLRPGSAAVLIVATHLGRGDVAAAERLADDVFENTRCSELAYLLKAQVLEHRSRWTEIEKLLSDGISTCRTTGALELKYGEVKLKQAKYGEALTLFDELLSRNPANVKALFFKGVVNSRLKNFEQALQHYRTALEVSPGYAPALNNLAFLLCKHRDRCEEAMGYASAAIASMPESHEVNSTLGYLFLRNNEPAKAAAFLRKAVAISPGNADYQRMLKTALAQRPGHVLDAKGTPDGS